MNRESEVHFRELPQIHINRSKMLIPADHKTTFNVGQFVPVMCREILPGETINMKMSCVVRMQTPLFPTMQNLMMDVMFFFVPMRLLWTHFKEFWGESTDPWRQAVEYEIPQITTDATHPFTEGSLADHLELPINIAGISVNALPFRGYVKIWNDWMRDINLQQESPNTFGDNSQVHAAGSTYKGGTLLNANKLHDYFTSALPDMQRGPIATLPLGSKAPVYPRADEITPQAGQLNFLTWRSTDNNNSPLANGRHNLTANVNTSDAGKATTYAEAVQSSTLTNQSVYPSNLWVDLSQATAATLADLRMAISINHFFEAMARGGNRYTDFLRNIFGVVSEDARLQRSEYIGGKRIPINVQGIVQSSSTDATSPLGTVGAYSHTSDADEYFTKSFTEAGYLYCMVTVRYQHLYQQGIKKMFSRRKWYDFFVPQLENISEMPIKNKEIYATGTSTDEEIFGYQEPWAEYRYEFDSCTGQMRSQATQSLDAWHFGDDYASLPILGSSWIQEDKTNVDRTLAVTSSTADQLFGDFYFRPVHVKPMQIYSVPGVTKI